MNKAPVVLINHLLEPPAKITGITRYLFALLEELASNKSFHYVLATTWPREELPQTIRTASVDSITRRFIPSAPLNVMAQMMIVPRLMREVGASLEFNCNPVGCLWPFWPRVITVHDLYYELMPQDFPRKRLIGWRLLFPRALDAASAVICVSEASRQNLIRFYPRSASRAAVVHEAGALKEERQQRDSTFPAIAKPYALYVGNISANKNPAVLVDALKLLEKQGKSIRVVHVGRDELQLLENAQRRAVLTNPIQSMGTINDVELAAAYRGARCLINTSLEEGFCLPILEAQSRGVPAICSDIPVLREVAGQGAVFFNSTDPAALAEALLRLFIDESLHTQTVERARQNSMLFSWKRAAAETETIFRNVLERKNPGTARS